jgi:hypothetical protein
MTNEERKAIVRYMKGVCRHPYMDNSCKADVFKLAAAADQIEADGQRIAELEREVERRTYDGIHTCHDQCQRVACVQRRRIAELEASVSGQVILDDCDQHKRIAELEGERAAIVAWLRKEQAATESLRDELNRFTAGYYMADEHASALEQSADSIEAGEHLK